MATGNFALPPPVPLDIHSDQAGEKWKRFKRAWDSYTLATGLNGKGRRCTSHDIVDGDRRRGAGGVFHLYGWAIPGDDKKIDPVLQKFGQYCEPQKNIPFE